MSKRLVNLENDSEPFCWWSAILYVTVPALRDEMSRAASHNLAHALLNPYIVFDASLLPILSAYL